MQGLDEAKMGMVMTRYKAVLPGNSDNQQAVYLFVQEAYMYHSYQSTATEISGAGLVYATQL